MKKQLSALINSPRRLWLLIAAIYVGCSMVYAVLERKGPIESLWWGIVTGSTVGYGDFYPSTTAGRGVGSVLICSMLILVPIAIGHVIANLVHDRDAYTHEEQERSRQVDDETNTLVRWLITQQYGAEQLQRLLDESEQARHDQPRASADSADAGSE